MFWGLCKLLTGITKWEDVKTLSSSGKQNSFRRFSRWFNSQSRRRTMHSGDNSKVDLLVGDIYGTSYESIGLSADVIASRYALERVPSVDLE